MNPGNFASEVDSIFLFVLITSVIFLVGLTAAMVYFIWRYHEKRNPTATDIHGNLYLEMTWTVVPTLLVLAMFYFGMTGYRNMSNPPEEAMTVKTTGRMWTWSYTYDNGFVTDTLFVPVGMPVVLALNAPDVLHSFYIPKFRVKKDAVPGVPTEMWFAADQADTLQVFCAEYCGEQHSAMLSTIVALPREQYDAWYASVDAPAPGGDSAAPSEDVLARRGARLAKLNGCVSCHSADGTRVVGPTFKGLYGRLETVIADGEESYVKVDEEYIRRSILQPDAEKVKGYENIPMPPQSLTDDEIAAIVAYMKSLR